MADGNGNGNGRTAWVATNIVAPLTVTCVVCLAAWAWSLQSTNASQDVTLGQHGTRLDNHSDTIRRMDDKLDRILDRLGARP